MFASRALFAAVRSLVAGLRPDAQPPGPLLDALTAMDAGRFDEAETAFEAALASAPSAHARAGIHNKRGVAYIVAGRRDSALDAFASALECDPTFAAALTNVGSLLFENGHPLDAIDYYRAAIASDETYALAFRNLGIALRKIGKRGESVSALRRADRLEARPRRPRA